MLDNFLKNPYRFYFPLALLCLLYGSALWVQAGVFKIGDLPIQEHAFIFFGGFLFFSINGFALTAVPQFTKSSHLTVGEFLFGGTFSILNIIFFKLNLFVYFWMSIVIGWIFLMTFFYRRLKRKSQNPPYSFIFVIIGISLGFLGSLCLTASAYDYNQFEEFERWGKVFFYDGMVTSFVLGVGIRLLPGIWGFESIVQSQKNLYERDQPFLEIIPKSLYLMVLFFLLSLILEVLDYGLPSFLIRALIISFVALRFWALHKKIPHTTWHGRMIKVACYFLVFGSWCLCFFQEHLIHMKHFVYIGTYILLTLMISSRVILVHAKERLDIEKKKIPYLLLGGLLVLATFTRATAFILPDSYENHLGYAGLVLFLSAFFWGIFFSRKYLKGVYNVKI